MTQDTNRDVTSGPDFPPAPAQGPASVGVAGAQDARDVNETVGNAAGFAGASEPNASVVPLPPMPSAQGQAPEQLTEQAHPYAAGDDMVSGGFTDAEATTANAAIAWPTEEDEESVVQPGQGAAFAGFAGPTTDSTSDLAFTGAETESAVVNPAASVASPEAVLVPQQDGFEPSEGLQVAEPQSKAAHPRTGTIVACGILGAVFLLLAALVYVKGVLTDAGQGYDTMVWWTMSSQEPFTEVLVQAFHVSAVVLGIAGAAAVAGLAVAAVRRRVGLIIQLIAFAAVVLIITGVAKSHLPRTTFNPNRPNPANSAPSGHTLLFAAAMIALMLAVSRAWRAWVALIGWLASSAVGLALVAGRWHRPSDVVMSLFIAGAIACIVLAFTRGSGMDRIVDRKPSAAVQIVAPALIVLGVMALGYSLYGIWQLLPNLADEPTWGVSIACESAVAAIVGAGALVSGVVCALRQLTASPLTGTGIFGTPPRPPKAK
jgi:membrane-associated phospholipid phosphatase